jgi:hypothetical protein
MESMQNPGGLPLLGGTSEPPPELQTRRTMTGRLFSSAGLDKKQNPFYEFYDPSSTFSVYQALQPEFSIGDMVAPSVKTISDLPELAGAGTLTNDYTGRTTTGLGEVGYELAGRAVPPIAWSRRLLQSLGRDRETGKANAFGRHVTDPLVGTIGQRDESPAMAMLETLMSPIKHQRESLGPSGRGYPGSDVEQNYRNLAQEADRLQAEANSLWTDGRKHLPQDKRDRLDMLNAQYVGVSREAWLAKAMKQAVERNAARQ